MIRPRAKPLSVRTRIFFPAPKRSRMVATIRSKARHRSVTGIASARTRLCPERHVPAEAVEWRVTIVPVVAVIEAPPLSPVDRVIGRIEIQEDHPSRARRGRRHRPVGQRALNPRGVGHDPLVAGVRPLHGELHAVQSRLARERTATVAARASVRPERIVPRRIVIVEILISRREAETTLSRQLFDRMPDQIRVAMVAKATRQTPHETVLVFDLARGERAAVTGKTPPPRNSPPLAAHRGLEIRGPLVYTPSSGGGWFDRSYRVSHRHVTLKLRPSGALSGEKCGLADTKQSTPAVASRNTSSTWRIATMCSPAKGRSLSSSMSPSPETRRQSVERTSRVRPPGSRPPSANSVELEFTAPNVILSKARESATHRPFSH